MKQILQNFKNGQVELADIPKPQLKPGHVLIQTSTSLISIGTEKMLIEFGRSNLIDKARKQPDKVKQVLQKIKTDGLITTLESVQNKLDTPTPLGYCNVGKVIDIGAGVHDFKIGDRVLSNGSHSEMVCVSKNLCAKIPDNVSDTEACYGVTAAIGLQGIRLLDPKLGETIVVVGMGLIGLLSAQMLLANGCRVIGIDFDKQKLEIAKKWGVITVDAASPVPSVLNLTQNLGVDGVLITASTSSNDVLHHAAEMCRKRGKVVLVGIIGKEWSRDDFYKKEISFQVSCSYGPGRYDELYEDKAIDYPYAYVRWTEKRNFEAVLELMSTKRLDVSELTTKTVNLEAADKIYTELLNDKSLIGVTITYPQTIESSSSIRMRSSDKEIAKQSGKGIAFLGAGQFTKAVLLPKLSEIIKSIPAELHTIVSSQGVSSQHLAKKFGFSTISTNVDDVFSNPDISSVFITTRHDTHADLCIKGLKSNKYVFVEKPLCCTESELEQVDESYKNSKSEIMVGFNRRFSPHSQKVKSYLNSQKGPKSLIFTINAGYIPDNHWTQDPDVGGGRIIGEAVHFIDLAQFFVGAPILSVQTIGLDTKSAIKDTISIQLTFEDGSIATVHYFSTGHKSFPKERLTIFSQGTMFEIDNFKETKGYGVTGFKKLKTWSQDKGHKAMLESWMKSCVSQTKGPISYDELFDASKAAILAEKSIRNNNAVYRLNA